MKTEKSRTLKYVLAFCLYEIVMHNTFAQIQDFFFQRKKQNYKIIDCDMLETQVSLSGVLTG